MRRTLGPIVLLAAAAIQAAPALQVQRPVSTVIKGLDARGSQIAMDRVEQVIAILQADAAIAEPPPNTTLRLVVDTPKVSDHAVQTRLEVRGPASGGPNGGPASGVIVWINNPVSFLPDGGLDGLEGEGIFDDRGLFYLHPVPENRSPAKGFPSFRGAVTIAKASPPAFVPVTKEEHLQALLVLWPRAIERARRDERTTVWDRLKGYPYPFTVIPTITGRLEAELASLSPSERQLPACFGWTGERPLLMTTGGRRPCTPDRQIARRNPAFFGDTLDPGRIHVVTVSNREALFTGFDRTWPEWTKRFMQVLDYAALARLVG